MYMHMYVLLNFSILLNGHVLLLFTLIIGMYTCTSCATAMTITKSAASIKHKIINTHNSNNIIRIPRYIWERVAVDHQDRIHTILQSTLMKNDDDDDDDDDDNDKNNNSSPRKSPLPLQRQQQRRQQNKIPSWIRPLDPKNPKSNFLIEYYGLKGLKGVKRLARWCPSPNLLLNTFCNNNSSSSSSSNNNDNQLIIDTVEDYVQLSSLSLPSLSSFVTNPNTDEQSAPMGIFLEDVREDDFASLLHLKGVILESNGALYSPFLWYQQKQKQKQQQQPQSSSSSSSLSSNKHPASSFLWYRSILKQTLHAEPILHCHGLHEWAMQYRPSGAVEPPSSKYQKEHLTLRVNQQIINETVERKGISCTHVDALRFFAPAAASYNHHGSSLQRMDQLRLEQPACVHAHMDLLKIILKLQPFCNTELLQRILQLSLDARYLDVAASPYDARKYGIPIIPIETKAGRAEYRKEQKILMERAKPIRAELLESYNIFLQLAFQKDPEALESSIKPSAERYAQAEPGGKPWRRNLITDPSSSSLSSSSSSS